MTTPTPTAPSAELQAAIEAMVCIVDTGNTPQRYHVEVAGNIALCRTDDKSLCQLRRDGLVKDICNHLVALSQSSAAQRAVEAIEAKCDKVLNDDGYLSLPVLFAADIKDLCKVGE